MDKKLVKTIDLTPTWQSVLPALLAVYTDGNQEGRKEALHHLNHMAKVADMHVESLKKKKK